MRTHKRHEKAQWNIGEGTSKTADLRVHSLCPCVSVSYTNQKSRYRPSIQKLNLDQHNATLILNYGWHSEFEKEKKIDLLTFYFSL